MRLARPEREDQGQRSTRAPPARPSPRTPRASRRGRPRRARSDSAMTGSEQTTRPRTGTSRAASLPSTISASDRSVNKQVRQRPARPVEADGPGGRRRGGEQDEGQLRADHGRRKTAARRPPGPGSSATTHRSPRDDQVTTSADEQEQDEQRPQGVPLPAPRRGEPLELEDRARPRRPTELQPHRRASPLGQRTARSTRRPSYARPTLPQRHRTAPNSPTIRIPRDCRVPSTRCAGPRLRKATSRGPTRRPRKSERLDEVGVRAAARGRRPAAPPPGRRA